MAGGNVGNNVICRCPQMIIQTDYGVGVVKLMCVPNVDLLQWRFIFVAECEGLVVVIMTNFNVSMWVIFACNQFPVSMKNAVNFRTISISDVVIFIVGGWQDIRFIQESIWSVDGVQCSWWLVDNVQLHAGDGIMMKSGSSGWEILAGSMLNVLWVGERERDAALYVQTGQNTKMEMSVVNISCPKWLTFFQNADHFCCLTPKSGIQNC